MHVLANRGLIKQKADHKKEGAGFGKESIMKLFRKAHFLLAIALAILLNRIQVGAATYWLAPKGRVLARGSEADPFPSMEVALKQVGGGSTFIFKPGTYLGRQVTLLRERAGTPQKPTVLKSQQKYEAIIHGSPGHGISVTDGCE